jgi:hypothetical protein
MNNVLLDTKTQYQLSYGSDESAFGLCRILLVVYSTGL